MKKVTADARQCEQILMNLCINAKDSMPEGGKLTLKTENVRLQGKPDTVHINLTAGDYIRLTIADTGHCISEDTLMHIYEPFFTTKGKGKGTGLGLPMVYAIVQSYDGAIECSSEEGIAKYLQNQVDLVLLDVSMPGIGGVKCLRQIISLSPEVKVIIISGYLSDGRVEEAMTLGAKAFLTKPYSFEELLTTVRNVLEKDSCPAL